MKKNLTIPILFLALLFINPIYNVRAEESTSEYTKNTLFKNSKLRVKENTFILDYRYEDVNGDNIKDNIVLTGIKKNGAQDIYSYGMKLLVQDGRNNKFYKVSLGKKDCGFKGNLFVGDFDGDRINDILVSFNNEDKREGSSYSLISFRNNKRHYLFKQEVFSNGLSFEVQFVDGLKANIYNKALNKYYPIDLSNKRDTYINGKIYDSNGELIRPVKGTCTGLIELRPVDIDNDGVFELKGIQRFIGAYEQDTIAYAKSIWKYEDSKLLLASLEVIRYGRPGNNQKIQRIIPVFYKTN